MQYKVCSFLLLYLKRKTQYIFRIIHKSNPIHLKYLAKFFLNMVLNLCRNMLPSVDYPFIYHLVNPMLFNSYHKFFLFYHSYYIHFHLFLLLIFLVDQSMLVIFNLDLYFTIIFTLIFIQCS